MLSAVHAVVMCLSVRLSVRLQIMPHDRPRDSYFLNEMFCSYRISTDKRVAHPPAIAEPLVNFGCPIHISQMAEARALNFFTKGDCIKSCQKDGNHP